MPLRDLENQVKRSSWMTENDVLNSRNSGGRWLSGAMYLITTTGSHITLYPTLPSSTDTLETQSFPEADKKMISEMVKEKKFESLGELGGVKQVLQVLESDPKRGVSDTEDDLARRRIFFRANWYAKQPLKSFLSFVLEALKDTTIILLLVCAVLALGLVSNKKA
ncbi:hypothetical protein LWI29_018971 [Acer saccharum]|uniref:Cation-transporting P-type ATPase N-terminal domain-containing protein n=1 Tax=Acer saccharum TaxID=4024 RepID=A0AA39W1G7_ACESA|nr:hypothetical protein LWI29_018971 [Acer saccharum]